MVANFVITTRAKDTHWLVDSVVSHNITKAFQILPATPNTMVHINLSIDDGLGLSISHVGSLKFKHSTGNFHFHVHDTLYVPNIQKKF